MVNLHTHTQLCKHAQGMPVDFARAAVEKGFTVLGFSDHTPFPDDRILPIRMAYGELSVYLAGIEEARQRYPQLKILAGMECEYFPELHEYYQDILLGESGLDYLIGSVHFYLYHGRPQGFWGDFRMDREALQSYTAAYTQMLESGLFLFGAHPDTFGASIDVWNEDCEDCARSICETAARLSIPLEINTSGWLKADQHPESPVPYPLPEFWQTAARYGVKVLVNSDAHAPAVLDAYLAEGYRLAESCGLEVVCPFGD